MIHCAFVLLPSMLSSSATLPAELLQSAEDISRSQRQPRKLTIDYLSYRGASIKTHSGLTLSADKEIDNALVTQGCLAPDVVFLPAVWRHADKTSLAEKAVCTWLKKVDIANPRCVFAAVSTGAFVLAESGLLNGHQATTHWAFLDKLAQRYPKIDVQRDRFITESSNKFCSGSVNSAADITVELIRRTYGEGIADTIARHYFHELRERVGGDPRWSFKHLDAHPDESIVYIQRMIDENFATITVPDLVEKSSFSTRTLNRRFKQATGITPLEYIHRKKIDVALSLLKNTNLQLDDIANESGFSERSYFNRIFKRQVGIPPREYRRTVRAKLFG